MKAVKYTWSGDHKTVVDIGSNDTVVRIAINMAIEQYKKSFRSLCHTYYKNHIHDFVTFASITDTKKVIRDLKEIRDAIDHPVETCDQPGARMTVATWF